jgi:hypothetical protein
VDILKLFPALFLDLISKIVPGCIFLLVFQNRYLPPTELVLQLLSLQSLSADWQSWYRVVMIMLTAYMLGIFIAMISNAIDTLLIKHHWFKVIARAPDEFIYSAEQPKDLRQALTSPSTFSLFVDHCRSYISINNTSASAMLEKYRTAYRLFVGLSLLFIALPLGLGATLWSFGFALAPVAAWLSFCMSKRYLQKSIQYFALGQGIAASTNP